MRKIFVFLLMLVCTMQLNAFDTIETDVGSVTPFLDAEIHLQKRWGGVNDYSLMFVTDFDFEGGFRYDNINENGTKYFANLSLYNPYHQDNYQTGELNFGIAKNRSEFRIGRGTYKYGIVMKNHHFNVRKEVWAPTALSIFSYNVIGEYKEAIEYIHNFTYFKLKTALMQDVGYMRDNNYRRKGFFVPVMALETTYGAMDFEVVYSNFKDMIKTQIYGIQFNLPSDIRIETEYTIHTRDVVAMNLADSPDSDIDTGLGLDATIYMDNFSYKSFTLIAEKDFFINDKKLTLFGQYYEASTITDFVFVTSLFSFSSTGDYPRSKNWQGRLGMSYEVTPAVSTTLEYEHNTMDVLPHWKHRVNLGFRLKL